MIEKQYTLIGITGFARAATFLVREACTFSSSIFLECEGEAADLKNPPKSLIDVMSLGIKPGARIQIRAEGPDEYEALQGIESS